MILLNGVTDEDVENALVEIARHIPLDVEIGTPIGASRDGDDILITAGGRTVWLVDPDNVGRLSYLGDGLHVYTGWRWRVTLCDAVGYDYEQEA